ncbi:hypothetical protein F7725_011539 [Dissostichus mawsoni]|uniref:Uncharacterized protein n=1 Tax=Dissostichus mawsoni TaxID=36200 RepID=A0A7J5ZDC8_DISMA|nr:hypothetical protein F7725_011539 [Dissostichus mawsoni]
MESAEVSLVPCGVCMSKAPVLLILIGPHRRRFRPAIDPRFSMFPPFSQIIRGSRLLQPACLHGDNIPGLPTSPRKMRCPLCAELPTEALSSSSSCSAVKVVRLRRCFLFRGRPGSESTSEPSSDDEAGPLYLSREKPVAGLCWTDYHAPSVGAIRDARARIQGSVTCPAGESGGVDFGDAAVGHAQLTGDDARPDAVVGHLHDFMANVVGERSAVYEDTTELVHPSLS